MLTRMGLYQGRLILEDREIELSCYARKYHQYRLLSGTLLEPVGALHLHNRWMSFSPQNIEVALGRPSAHYNPYHTKL
jgi:hypothetical protein